MFFIILHFKPATKKEAPSRGNIHDNERILLLMKGKQQSNQRSGRKGRGKSRVNCAGYGILHLAEFETKV
jgi:hypothetical protein